MSLWVVDAACGIFCCGDQVLMVALLLMFVRLLEKPVLQR
jgi:hypothetical protein